MDREHGLLFLRPLQTSDSKCAPASFPWGSALLGLQVDPRGRERCHSLFDPLPIISYQVLPGLQKSSRALARHSESLLGDRAGGGGRVKEEEIESDEKGGRVLAPRARAGAKERRWERW